MHYKTIEKFDLNNGPGVRVSLWVSGCPHKCEGCHNAELFNYKAGTEFTPETMQQLVNLVKDDKITGLSILGGEPLCPENIITVATICRTIRTFTSKSIWIWTGYDILNYKNDNKILSSIIENNLFDVVIDGPYNKDKPTKKPFRGSDNQRMFALDNSKLELIQ